MLELSDGLVLSLPEGPLHSGPGGEVAARRGDQERVRLELEKAGPKEKGASALTHAQ